MGHYSDTVRRCETLIRKHAPKLMTPGAPVSRVNRPVSPELVRRVLELRASGLSQGAIGRKLNRPQSTICLIIKRQKSVPPS